LGTDVGSVLDQPLADTANDIVADTHAFLETVGHEVGFNAAIHGITNLGNTVGLGEIGGDNLVTDVIELPGVVLGGGDIGAQLGDINTDIGDIVDAVPPIVTGLVQDLGDGPADIGLLGTDGLVGQVADGISGTSSGSLPLVGGLLGPDSLSIPSLGGAGTDSLVGTLLDTAHSAVPTGSIGDGLLSNSGLGGDLLGDATDTGHHPSDLTGHDGHGALGLGICI
jgi:hypothetical protein